MSCALPAKVATFRVHTVVPSGTRSRLGTEEVEPGTLPATQTTPSTMMTSEA